MHQLYTAYMCIYIPLFLSQVHVLLCSHVPKCTLLNPEAALPSAHHRRECPLINTHDPLCASLHSHVHICMSNQEPQTCYTFVSIQEDPCPSCINIALHVHLCPSACNSEYFHTPLSRN